MAQSSKGRSIKKSLKEYARGIAGGLLFSFPLLYTMEVWWEGFIADPLDLLILVLVTYVLLLGYNRFAGMHPDASWGSVLADSVEEIGIGLLISFGVLIMLNRIQLFDMSSNEIMGKVIVEAMAVSIGVSIGTAQLGAEEEEKERDQKQKEERQSGARSSKLAMFVLGLCGAIVVGGNVAPTEEIVLIAIEAEPSHILAMALVSLVLSVVVLFFSNFKGSSLNQKGNEWFDVAFDTCICYLTALGASAFILWFFGRFENTSLWIAFAQVIVLGVISTLGASAGRLLIK